VGGKFRSVHTLDSGDAVTEIASMGYKQGILKYISSFAEIIEKEICAGIFCGLVVAKGALPFVTA
jgi:hypothetical protein